MSDELFPELPGLEWELTKTPIFNTKIMTSVNGRELRASYQAIPKYNITMSFAFLRESKGRNELQQLEGFFLDRRGAFDSFLYKMPEDNQFDCKFVGDDSTTVYPLFKNMNGRLQFFGNTKAQWIGDVDLNMWNQNIGNNMWNTDESRPMWNKVSAQITSDGKYILAEPVESGIEFNAVGTYYYRCRFKDDEQQFTNFMSKLWKASKVELVGTLGAKI